MSPPVTHRLILNVAAAQHELETVAILMSSIGAVVAHARQNEHRWMRGALDQIRSVQTREDACE